jgi:hypothetical protein
MRWGVTLALALALTLFGAQGAEPDPTKFGVTIERGDVRRAQQWLDEGLDPDFLADRIGTGLMIGAWEGNIAMMELFHSRGADVNRVSPIGEQALQLAAWNGHLDAVKWLLERGAQIDRNGKQWSALHYAAFAGHKHVVRFLIEQGADINARTTNDSTALMLTAREGHQDVAQMLLDAGADTTAVNDWGDSALTWAMRYNNLRIAQIVAPPEDFARAAQAPPESFGTPSRSERAPPEVAELLRQLRFAEADGRPTGELRRAFLEAVARFKEDSLRTQLKGKSAAKSGKPSALLITAKRKQAGSERAELVYERGGTSGKPGPGAPEDVAAILEQIRAAQAKGRPTAELRKALFEAVSRFKRDTPAASVEENR